MDNDEYKDYANRNYYLFFVKPEEQASKIQDEINEIMAQYNGNESLVKEKLKEELGEGVEFYDDSYLFDLINLLTTDNNGYASKEEYAAVKRDIRKFIPYLPNVRSMSAEEKTILPDRSIEFCVIDTTNGLVEFSMVDKLIAKSGKTEDIQNDEDANYYCSDIKNIDKRNGMCHLLSVSAAKLFSKYFNIKSNVVTGYASYYVPKNKYLHSWIELCIDGKEYVIDSTKNVIMNKEGYYLLMHVDEREICSIISSDDIVEDEKVYGGFIEQLDDYKTYVVARDGIIRDLEKNRHLFVGPEDNGEEER